MGDTRTADGVFPTRFEFYTHKDTIGGTANIDVFLNLWTGTEWIDIAKGNGNRAVGKGSVDASGSLSDAAVWPYANTFTWSDTPKTITCPADDSTVTQTVAVTAVDQYGVQMFNPTWSVSSNVSSSGLSVNPTSSSGSTTINLTKASNIAGDTNSQTGTVTATWKGKNQTKTSSQTFTIDDALLTATFNYKTEGLNTSGAETTTTQTARYGSSPAAPTAPGMYYTETDHYTFDAWENSGTKYTSLPALTNDMTFEAAYTVEAHEFDTYENVSGTGTHTKGCSACGYSVTEDCNWDSGTEIDAPTCIEKGTTKYTCVNCNNTRTEQDIATIAHSYTGEIKSNGDGTHSYKCEKGCGEYGGTVDCTYTPTVTTEPSCTTAGVTTYTCTACGYSYTENIPVATGHNFSEKDTSADFLKSGATCTEAPVYYYKCVDCGTSSKDIDDSTYTSGDTLGHTEVVDAAVAPGCTTTGLTEGKHCSVCNEVLVAQQTVDALGHDMGAYVETKAASCTEKGEERSDCSRCDYYETREIDMIAHTEEAIPAKAATCTETGLTEGKKCSVCNAVLVAQTVVPATGHTEEIISGKDATCTETGLTEGKHCSVCNIVLVAQDVVPATGHTEVVDTAKDATCTATGLTEGKHCSVCNAVLVAQEVVPATGHTEVVDAAKDATCTETGLTEGKHCPVCDAVLVAQDVVPAKGHTAVSADNAVAATCTTDGKKADTVCSVCGTLIKAGSTIPATGHDWVEASRTEATCSKDGSITYVCKNDSSHIKTETIPATGAHHDDDNDGFCDDCHTEYNPSQGHDGCICHKDNIFSKIIRYICTLLTKIFHKRIACCDDMEYYKGKISSIT